MKTGSFSFRNLALVFAAGILGLAIFTIWWINDPAKPLTAAEEVRLPIQEIRAKTMDYSSRDGDGENRVRQSAADEPLSPLRLRSIAQHTYLRVMSARPRLSPRR